MRYSVLSLCITISNHHRPPICNLKKIWMKIWEKNQLNYRVNKKIRLNTKILRLKFS